MAHSCILPDYTLTWVMTIWDHYYQTGDKALVREQADRMRRALSYFEGVTAPNGLLPYDERYWVFLDWADIFKEGYATVYNLFYFMRSKRPRSSCPDWREGGCRQLRPPRRALRAAIMERLFDAKRRAFYGGLDWKGRPVKSDTPHAYALAVIAGICPERDGSLSPSGFFPSYAASFPRRTSPPTPSSRQTRRPRRSSCTTSSRR